ncbi:hypothetical protein OGAPHI_000489 [Ogataea philodendri]|uniref:HSF-type DNA-binding domain-containing protein n=1 Tax=Ogataea philodendri TaxID=1378263 RepID=A0A9P8T9W5_9ASCO|nr:uncharacterized protein OGAPHI_000489 [Ogataea philodendri]KAH3671266.1 hypothetical protein OGAPHI_000489 [Ogataea philodendri]
MLSEEPVLEPKPDDSKEVREKEQKNSNTSFIHKLYAMLEDHDLDHLIWWHSNQTSFYVLPSEEFTRVLSNYFKHANVASFIRQLNMYGFHKVNDNFNNETLTTTPPPSEQAGSRKGSNSSNNSSFVWEFKHSSDWFRQGNVEGLTQIKRRSFKNVTSQKEVHNIKVPPIEGAPEPQNYVPYRYQPNSPGDMNDTTVQEEMDMKSRMTNSYLQQQMSTSVPKTDAKYMEVAAQYSELLRSYDMLNYRYEIVKEDLTKTNYDCVSLIDVLRDVVGLVPKDPVNEQVTSKVLTELEKFKTNVLQRCAARDMAFKQLSNGPGYYGDSGMLYSEPPSSLAGPMPTPHVSISHSHQPVGRNLSASSFHPYEPSQMPYKDIRYSVSSNRSRNLSVFDPLQPATPALIPAGHPPQGPEQSPAVLNQAHEGELQPIHRDSNVMMPFSGSPGPPRRSSPGLGNPPVMLQSLSTVQTDTLKTRSSSTNSLPYLHNATSSPTNNLRRAGSNPTPPTISDEKRGSQGYSLANPPRSLPQINTPPVHEPQRNNSTASTGPTNPSSTAVFSLLNPSKSHPEDQKRDLDQADENVKRARSQ